ncbi:MAG: hypothetical protein IIC29_08965, partial [Chloroflexi bacterium]|nr:hypothetical protein [Chloroflexota bacterium]
MTLGITAEPVTITAELAALPDVDVRFTAVALPGPPATLSAESDSLAVGAVGSVVTEALAVLVTDQFGNGVPAATVGW